MKIVVAAIGLFLLLAPQRLCGAESGVKIAWSRATQSYEFDTGSLFGCIDPHSWYHGVAGLVQCEDQVDVVRPRKAFLNAEYYRKPGMERRMLPRMLSIDKKTTHELSQGRVFVRFPEEPLYGFAMELAYRPHADAVDMQVTIRPSKDVPQFEIFFASYVCESFSETWTPLKSQEGEQRWKRLDNRNVINECFGVLREVADGTADGEGGSSGERTGGPPRTIEKQPFSKPILVARNPSNGLAIVFLCDPHATTSLAGQYHGWDTAHDWWFGADLAAGQPMRASARMIYRRFEDPSSMFEEVDREWSDFTAELAEGR
jgi:hypothetical protein